MHTLPDVMHAFQVVMHALPVVMHRLQPVMHRPDLVMGASISVMHIPAPSRTAPRWMCIHWRASRARTPDAWRDVSRSPIWLRFVIFEEKPKKCATPAVSVRIVLCAGRNPSSDVHQDIQN
jgi:hypothetical protein